jgi:hypothetical protein
MHKQIRTEDREVLRRLGSEIAEIAALPVHKEKALLWKKLNDLDSQRPMVWINEIPWHEMNVDDELTLQCDNPWARNLENNLRKKIYQWKHMPADMIVSEYIECPLSISSTGFGIEEDVDVIKMDQKSSISSRHFNIQIKEPEDIEKIKMPVVTYDAEDSEYTFKLMSDIFKDIIKVKKTGQKHIWFTPWDYLIRWWGVEEAMMDLIMRPDMVHDAVDRMVDGWMSELDQFVEQNLLSLDCNNTRIGSGGYGYTGDLPGADHYQQIVKPSDMWGCSNAQIFSDVSPEMHWEFAISHDIRWLERWGLTYYGCCEPLHNKIEILKKIKNLRKISVSPWCNSDKIISEAGDRYVLSRKPNPAIFAESVFSKERAEKELKDFFDRTGGKCHVEFIMKDISTVKYRPQDLWEWEKTAMKVVNS